MQQSSISTRTVTAYSWSASARAPKQCGRSRGSCPIAASQGTYPTALRCIAIRRASTNLANTQSKTSTSAARRTTAGKPAATGRDAIAVQFRKQYGCSLVANGVEQANVVPYFIGVFDTVAALGHKYLGPALVSLGVTILLDCTISAVCLNPSSPGPDGRLGF
jgi:hypothetical protein